MKKTTLTILILLAVAAICRAGDRDSFVLHDDRRREFSIHVPPSYDGSAAVPLVIVLHGGGGNSRQIEKHTGFSKLADREGFIVVYPQGVNGQWNDGRDIKQSRAYRLKIDDTGFILKMLSDIKKEYKIDDTRIYVTGISNGGFMSMRLACEIPGRLAAVAVVCAGMNPYMAKYARPSSQLSILIMNGTADPLVPYNGGHVKIFEQTRGEVLSTADTLKYWLNLDGCSSNPVISGINPDTADGTEIERYDFNCGKNEVVLYRVIGGGHTWPGGAQYLPEAIIGKTSRDIKATEVIWNFFKRHHR